MRRLALVGCLVGAASARAQDVRRDEPSPPAPAPVVTRPPELVETAEPVYPPEAVAQKREATVKIEIDIDASGAATAVRVLEPVGDGFDEAAVAAARRYRFRPAEVDGKPAPITIETAIHFRLATTEAPAPVTAPAGPQTSLGGIVRARGSRRPLPGASVGLPDLGRETFTDAQGRFQLTELPVGTHRLVAIAGGYERHTSTVTLVDKVAEVTLSLRSSVGGDYQTTIEGERTKTEVTRRTLALLACAACDTGFADPEIVVDLRVLALVTEPAEVVVDFDPADPTGVSFPTVAVRALAIDPAAAEGRHLYRFTACPRQDNLRCDEEVAPHLVLGEGTAEAGQEEIAASLDVTLELLEGAVAEDPFGGFGGVPVNLELRIVAEGAPETAAVYAGKQVIYAPRLPPGRTSNQNPLMDGLDLDGSALAECAAVLPRQEVRLDPVEPAGIRETYVVPTLDGGQRTFTENIRYGWFATAGSFSSGNTGGPLDPFGNRPPSWTRWTAPEQPGDVRFWVVQRDERGGTFWTERCARVQN